MKGVTKNYLYVIPEVTNKHISVTPEGLWISTSIIILQILLNDILLIHLIAKISSDQYKLHFLK